MIGAYVHVKVKGARDPRTRHHISGIHKATAANGSIVITRTVHDDWRGTSTDVDVSIDPRRIVAVLTGTIEP